MNAITTQPNPRTRKRMNTRQRKTEAERLAKIQQEQRDAIVPAAQRHDVMVIDPATGKPTQTVLRAARVKRDGAAFVRVNPLRNMAEAINRAARDGTACAFSASHFLATRRLVAAWDLVGEGVGLGASDWGSIKGARGTAPTTPAGHHALLAQVEKRREIDAVTVALGAAMWGAVRDMLLSGMSPTAWAAKVGLHHAAAQGYLLAALDRLVEVFGAAEKASAKHVRIRAIGPARAAYSVDAAMVEVGVSNDA